MAVADYIPRTVNLQFSKIVSVIPFLYGIVFFHKSIIFQQILNFPIQKSKIFIILYIFYCVYIKIIQSGKDTFLWYPQTPCQDRKFQAVVCLKCISKQDFDQFHHGIVISWLVCLIKRHIIFINQHDDVPIIMLL